MASWLRRFMLLLVLSFPLSSWVSFIGTSQGRMKEHKVRIAAKPRGFGSPSKTTQDFDQKLGKDVEDVVEDAALELLYLEGLVERGTERVVSLPNKATVTLLGSCHNSQISARAVEEDVGKIRPSALLLELCKERLGVLIQGNGHREERTKNLMNPDELASFRRADARYADETRRAFRAFMNNSCPENVLVLMDVKDSDKKAAVAEEDEIYDNPDIMSMRDSNMAHNIFTVSLLGHKTIVAVVGAAHVNGVAEVLHELNRRYSEIDVALGEEIWDCGSCTGFYISHSGCKNIQDQQKNLKKAVPVRKWKKRKDLGETQQDNLEIKFDKLLNPDKILTSLCHKPQNFVEPCSWKDLRPLKNTGAPRPS